MKDELGQQLARVGNEFGSVTGRPRRCGWLDIVTLKRSAELNSFSALCITKLDVLDGLDKIKICVKYHLNDVEITRPPLDSDCFAACEPVYIELPGWKESTAGITSFDALPINAQKYLLQIEQLVGVPIDIISTGSDRKDTILLRNPYSNDINEIDDFYAEERT